MKNSINHLIQESIDNYKKGKVSHSKNIALKIISEHPNNFDANYILGIIANFEEQYSEAINYFDFILKINGRDPEIWNHRAIALVKKEKFEEAIESFEKALSLGGRNQEVIFTNIVTTVFQKNKNLMNNDYQKAIDYSKKALKINNQNVTLLNYLSLALIYNFQYDEAIIILKKILKINPKSVVAYQNIALAYKYKNEYSSAEKYYKKSLALSESNSFISRESNLFISNIKTALGEVQLSQLKFAEGWKNFISKSLIFNSKFSYENNILEWKPNMGYKKKILILGEFGIGDQILFSSILPDICNKFEKVSFLVNERLVEIMSNSFQTINIIGKNDLIIENYDCYLPMSALGLYFRKEITDFSPKRNLLVHDNSKINVSKKLKCALSWKSNNPEFGFLKSLNFDSLKYLTTLLQEIEIDFYNIQYTDENDDIKRLRNDFGVNIKKIEGLDTLNDIKGLSNFIGSCDFTINVSNSNAHLSAALNKKTYLLLSKGIGTLWYWQNEYHKKNLWYSCISIFRQDKEGKWEDPIDDLIKHLKKDFSPYPNL